MNSGKSTFLLQLNHQYKNQNHKTFLFKPVKDRRDGMYIRSRLNIEEKAELLPHVTVTESKYFDSVIFIDEIQFLQEDQYKIVREFADEYNCIVHCFGLRTNSLGKLFDGSKFLFEIADEIVEIDRFTCDSYGRKQIFHLDVSGLKSKNGIREGDVGKNDYLLVSRKDFFIYNKY